MDTLKFLLNITNDSQDALLQYYLDLSYSVIENYLRREIEDFGLDKEVVYLAQYYYQNRNNAGNGIQSLKQGQRSITYNTAKMLIPSEIMAMLPLPSVKAGAL
jgi:hypothetical protein